MDNSLARWLMLRHDSSGGVLRSDPSRDREGMNNANSNINV